MGIGLVVVREEKKKDAREMTLKVNAKLSLKAGKEKIQLNQLAVGALVTWSSTKRSRLCDQNRE
jgi:hypothetical protein